MIKIRFGRLWGIDIATPTFLEIAGLGLVVVFLLVTLALWHFGVRT